MLTIIDNSGFFSRYFPHRCNVEWNHLDQRLFICSYSGTLKNAYPLSYIDLGLITLDFSIDKKFCSFFVCTLNVKLLKMLSLEYKLVGLVSHFFHSLFACVISTPINRAWRSVWIFLLVTYIWKGCSICRQYEEIGQHIKNSYKFSLELTTSFFLWVALLIIGHRCPQPVKRRTWIPAVHHK